MTSIERLLQSVTKTDTCWVWTGHLRGNGYGGFRVDGRDEYVHRYAYRQMVGPIPLGFQIDHLCRNRLCVNPAHLEAVTQRENLLRGEGWSGRNAKKTHCKRGHALSGENLYFSPNRPTQRQCRLCTQIRGGWGIGKAGGESFRC